MKCVICALVLFSTVIFAQGDGESDYNEINPDGSFQFGLKINDRGGHYHEAKGNPKTIIRGRYGSRNPENGKIEETVYTAGRRGYRARGPQIHRKMDLSQVPRGPIGTPEDPLADPYDDPSYGFGFKTPTYSRREDQDRFGRVKGLYSYVDDIGEKHLVRYAASSQNGFEVTNSYPDAPNNVHYSSPLYKDPNRKARGRIAMQRKNNGQYSFISSGPDQRRSESVGPDGITRGSYSYLDDKGVQRTVHYVAGAGIGFRIVKSITGQGTHNIARPAVPELGVYAPQSNDLPPESLFFDDTPKVSDRAPEREEEPDLDKDINSISESGVNKEKPLERPIEEETPAELYPGGDPNSIVPEDPPRSPQPTAPPPRANRPSRPPPGVNRNRGNERRRNSHQNREYFGVNSVDFDGPVRAHVQNIDLLERYGRYPTPGDALRRDTLKYFH